MINLTIDGKPVQVPEGSTILNAAEILGIKIPTLCFIKDISPNTSCMLCVVKVKGRKNLLPACATAAEEGMTVTNDDPAVSLARKTALELLLSDHAGDCMGPCQAACPAGMDIPAMIRHIAAGRYKKAIEVIKEHIALPAVTGYICPAPCEKACRRGLVDEPISVRLIKKCTAELDISADSPYLPHITPPSGKRAAIIGSGPAGLAASYYLQRDGVSCTVYDDREKPGGMLRYGVPENKLPGSVLDSEIDHIRRLGVSFKQKVLVGKDISLDTLKNEYDAIFLAPGKLAPDNPVIAELEPGQKLFKVHNDTLQSETPKIFAGGDIRRALKLTVRSLADGRKAAASILQLLRGEQVTGIKKPFNIRMGKPGPEELEIFSSSSFDIKRPDITELQKTPDTDHLSREALYCMNCDCRKASSCKLRLFADEYGAKTSKYRGKNRGFRRIEGRNDIIYEPGKCINCGICIKITERKSEKLGLAFTGRGFDVRVSVPFGRSIEEGLERTAEEAVTACPTGALAFREKK